MWAKLLGITCAGVFVGAFLVELARSDRKRDDAEERQPDAQKPQRNTTAASA